MAGSPAQGAAPHRTHQQVALRFVTSYTEEDGSFRVWLSTNTVAVQKFVAHSGRVLREATQQGWLPAARYTNLRDVRGVELVGFLDIDWTNYCFQRHLAAVKATRPLVTVAQDITHRRQLDRVLDQALELLLYAERVIVVPKAKSLERDMNELIPDDLYLGFSVPTRYGGTRISPRAFQRPVHLLGGRPDVQRRLADHMPVVSLDCNRFTFDARFGDYFDGEIFRPHPVGGYDRCIRDSLTNINKLWRDYTSPKQLNCRARS